MKSWKARKKSKNTFIILILAIYFVTTKWEGGVEIQAAKGVYYGDVNKNGEVDVSDVAIVKLVLIGEKELSEDEKKRADVDADGSITEKDLALIKQYCIGVIQEFPAETLISELVVTKAPNKTSYYIGEEISLEGMEVTVFYGNGTSKKVTDYIVSGNTDKLGKQQITISYTEDGITRKAVQEIEVTKPHEHKYAESITKKATCTEEGVITYKCSCGDMYTKAIPKVSHIEVVDGAQEATCKNPGKTEGSHCSVCGVILKKQEDIPKTKHKNKMIKNKKEPSCSQEGYTGDIYCQDCGEKLSEGKIIKRKEHSWDKGIITKKPTATETGIKTYVCRFCGTVYQEVLPIKKPKAKTQKIKASSYKKTYGSKPFYLDARTNGNGKLTYKSSNPKVAAVSSKGKVTVKNYGITTITIKASKTSTYKAATKKITITILPKKVSLTASMLGNGIVRIRWKKDTSVTGYEFQVSLKKSFSSIISNEILGNAKTSVTIRFKKWIKKGKTYYARIRAYKTVKGKPYYGAWSNVVKVKVK